MPAYYNEFKPEAAHMLRQLIKDGLIAAGDVDERSIEDVRADDLKGYTQCHFFAGIGGWSVALRLALWADDRPIWTGSCPCQPFSSAGKQKAQKDNRHLWPVWFRLIRECRPTIIFGEQVSSAIAFGWWDDMVDDLEGEDYACGMAVLPACSVGKPHKRDRLWFVGHSRQQREGNTSIGIGGEGQCGNTEKIGAETRDRFTNPSSLGNAEYNGFFTETLTGEPRSDALESAEGQEFTEQFEGASSLGDVSKYVADTECRRLQGQGTLGKSEYSTPCGDGEANQSVNDSTGERIEWITCPDGKQRAVEPRIRLLAHGVQHRAPILHALGNAIVPQVAAEFIKATEGAVV